VNPSFARNGAWARSLAPSQDIGAIPSVTGVLDGTESVVAIFSARRIVMRITCMTFNAPIRRNFEQRPCVN